MTFNASLNEIVLKNESGLLSAHSSWERVQLLEITSILNGYAFPSPQFSPTQGIPLLRIRDILKSNTEACFLGQYDSTYLVESGELVVGMDGDFNCALWKGPPALLNQRVCKLSPDQRFYRRKLLAYALPGYLRAINAETPSLTVKHLSSRTVGEIPLPLPPLGEQERMVAEIEKQFTRLDAAVAALKRVQANLKRYRAAVLKAAVEGRLVPTEAELARREGRSYEPASELLKRILAERRARWEAAQLAKFRASGKEPKDDNWKAKYKEPANPDTTNLASPPEGWAWVNLGQISWLVQYGSSAKTTEATTGVAVLRMGNITINGRLELSEVKRLPDTHSEFPELLLGAGDLLFNRTNSAELVGKSAVYKGTPYPCSFASYLIRVKTLSGCDPHYLAACLNSSLGRDWVKSVVSQQVGQANVNGTKLQGFVFPMPPSGEQRHVTAEVDRRLSTTDQLETQVEANLKRADRLRQAILTRAFEGKLVPQDPNDEPASALLERIRAERNSGTATPGCAEASPRPRRKRAQPPNPSPQRQPR